MTTQTLNGTWQYRIGRGQWETVEVPFSRLPVGHSECARRFDCTVRAPRTFLQFEGITYAARVWLNGQAAGEMLPYCVYTFDVTALIRDRDNELRVELEDIAPAFGPSEGWENYGGIIRGVSLLYREAAYIDDCFFHCTLAEDYRSADFTVDLTAVAQPGDEYAVTLFDGDTPVAAYTQPAGQPAAPHRLEPVHLWSPDDPHLYRLCVSLRRDGRCMDCTEQMVGFRAFTCARHRFLLNGQPIFLRGVCRHEMVADSGHTPTVEQIEADLRQIKSTGSNFVRLVHYPHRRETLDIADRLGLMVSEEPGLWWSDTADPAVSAGSLEVLRRTIRRDRSHACIVFWLCFNECRFTAQFLIDSARVCRENDPTRLVSGANCMSNEDTLTYYNLCGFDFYTMHPYAQTFARAAESAKILHDKPLLFSEWGGHYVYNNPKLLGEFIQEMGKLWRADADEGALAGALFWCWAEVNDFNRSKPACEDGVLREGLVTADRKPTMIYDTFQRAWAEVERTAPPPVPAYYEPAQAGFTPKSAFTSTASTDAASLLDAARQPIPPALSRMRPRKGIVVGPILPDTAPDALARTPWVLTDGGKLAFTGDSEANAIILIGATSLLSGYPIAGGYGELAATVTVVADTGARAEFPLRNGIELTTAFTTLSSSRINPRAEAASRFALFGYDRNYENYLLNRLTLPLPHPMRVKEIRVESQCSGYMILVYGVFGE